MKRRGVRVFAWVTRPAYGGKGKQHWMPFGRGRTLCGEFPTGNNHNWKLSDDEKVMCQACEDRRLELDGEIYVTKRSGDRRGRNSKKESGDIVEQAEIGRILVNGEELDSITQAETEHLWKRIKEGYDAMYMVLKVILLTPHIGNYLCTNDPKAYDQVREAIRKADFGRRTDG